MVGDLFFVEQVVEIGRGGYVRVVQKRPGPSIESVGPNHLAQLKSRIYPSAGWSWVALGEQICWKRIADIIFASFYLLNLE